VAHFGPTWHKGAQNGTKRHKLAQTGPKRHKVAQNGTNRHKVAQNVILFVNEVHPEAMRKSVKKRQLGRLRLAALYGAVCGWLLVAAVAVTGVAVGCYLFCSFYPFGVLDAAEGSLCHQTFPNCLKLPNFLSNFPEKSTHCHQLALKQTEFFKLLTKHSSERRG
jgi:Flp pilus assembly protein TadB